MLRHEAAGERQDAPVGASLQTPEVPQISLTMDDRHSLTGPQAASETLPVPPRLVLAGLATLQRRELCDFLAIFDELSAMKVAFDSIRDRVGRFSRQSPQVEQAFKQRVQHAADAHCRGECTNAHLRMLVWVALRDALDLSGLVPLALATADRQGAEVASRTAQELSDSIRNAGLAQWPKLFAKVRSVFSNDQELDFAEVVRFEVARRIGEHADALKPALREQIVASLRSSIATLPDELRDAALEEAIRTGNLKTLSTLATGTAWGSVAVAVALADFSAYILAAQASALIPLLGGKTAVSALAVLANPLWGIPLLGGAWWVNRGMNKKLRRGQASQLCCVLAMRGLSCGTAEAELKRCLDDFKQVGNSTYEPAGGTSRAVIAKAKRRQRSVQGCLQEALASQPKLERYLDQSQLPPTPGSGVDELPEPLKAHERHQPGRRLGVTGEVAAVGSLTFADLVRDAALVDPRVVAAADFSRAETIDDVFSFGRFADGVHNLSDVSRAGAESNLLGYVAEAFVAVQLKGYDVEFPTTPNNPGHDLLVDGQPFQVKCYDDSGAAVSALEAHFSRYPDTPVFINGDVQPAVDTSGAPWIDRVFYVDGYDHESVKMLMDESLEAGVGLLDLSGPLFAAVFVGGRNLYRWHRRSIPLRDLPVEMILDGSIYSALALAGGLSGKLIGAILFGPAGAVIFGGVGGPAALFGSRHARQAMDKWLREGWLRDVDAATTDFLHALTSAMRRKIVWNYDRISQLGDLADPIRAWLRLTFEDRALAVAECMADMRELHGQRRQDPVEKAKASLRLMRDANVHPESVRDALGRVTGVLEKRPSTTNAVRTTTAPALNELTNLGLSGRQLLRRVRSRDPRRG